MEKKRRIKKKPIIIILITLIVLILLFFLLPLFFVNIKLYGDKEIVIDYGEEYNETGYKATLFGKNITKKVKVKNNIKEEFGEYKVEYSYKYWLTTIKVTRKVKRKDITAPNISLTGGDSIEVTIDTKYDELGYSAIDNYDGDVTDKVVINGNVNVNELGTYPVEYKVTDSSGNERSIIRNVVVEKVRPTMMSVSEYTLDGWYDEVKLTLTESKGEDYFNSVTMVGDSNVMLMYQYDVLDGLNAWAIPCLHAESMFYQELNIYGLNEKIVLLDAIKKYKPKRILLNYGSFSTSWISEDVFLAKADEMLVKIKEIDPNIQIGIVSIYPIAKFLDNKKFEQSTINRYNFLLLELAKKHNVKYLDVQSVLKGPDGYGNVNYMNYEGYHLTLAGYLKVKEYIMTHPFEEVK